MPTKVVDDGAVLRAAACIWGEVTDEFWSNATPDQQRRYIGIARAALTVAGVDGPYRYTGRCKHGGDPGKCSA